MASGSDRAELLIDALAESCGRYRDAFAAIGLTVVTGLTVRQLYRFLKATYGLYAGGFGLESRLRNYGEWAVVTGCTRGVGRELAKQLAAAGLNIILISRNETAIRLLAEEIEKRHSVKTVRITADFNKRPEMIYPDIQMVLSVNNVGVMHEVPEYFHRLGEDILWNMLDTNIGAAQILTQTVLNSSMIPKKRGLVVFLGSAACFHPTPQMSAYAATKKHLGYFAESLNEELQFLGYKNIHIQNLNPMYLATSMTAYSSYIGKPSILSPSPETYARHAVRTFGMIQQTTGYWSHSLQLGVCSWLPKRFWIFQANHLLTYFRRNASSYQSASSPSTAAAPSNQI